MTERFQVRDLVELVEPDEITPKGTLGTIARVGPGTGSIRYQVEWHDDTIWWALHGMLKLVVRPEPGVPARRTGAWAPPKHLLSDMVNAETKTITGVIE